MAVYKADNTGRDITQELTSFYSGGGSSSAGFMSVVDPFPPAIKEQHHLFNDAHLASLNSLKSLKKRPYPYGESELLVRQTKEQQLFRNVIFS